MLAMISSWFSGRCWRLLGLLSLIFPAAFVWSLWYAVNSDRDDIPTFMTQITPAGHCACESSTIFECSTCLAPAVGVNVSAGDAQLWTYQYGRDDENLGLSEEQCEVAFPGLYEDVNLAVGYWSGRPRIDTEAIDGMHLRHGMTRAIIYEGRLYVVATRSTGEDHRRKMLAVLSSMHRALSAARESPPNIEFVFSVEDKASDVIMPRHHPLWVLARKAGEQSLWLMPDFGFWAWDNVVYGESNEIGPYDEVVEKALAVEADLGSAGKEQKLVWRGKLSFAPKLRRALLEQSRNEGWSDVQALDWRVKQNYMKLEDHCKYQFIAHAEGRSYSAALKYRQACRSVIVSHRLQYIQHHHYLLVSHGPLQNYVEVERDFSDLPDKMADLLRHPARAQAIANNSVRTFRERYLTPAADACYWRALWRGYARVSAPAHLQNSSATKKKGRRGLRFETFVLLSSDEMLDFRPR